MKRRYQRTRLLQQLTEKQIAQQSTKRDQLCQQYSRYFARIDVTAGDWETAWRTPTTSLCQSLDIFFVCSMAAEAGIATSTLYRKIYEKDPAVAFIVRFEHGSYGSCVSSMQAYGETLRMNDGRVNHACGEKWVTKP
jgi:hypothetical protein